MNIKYIIRRLTFVNELKGTLPKIKYFIQELISLTTRIRPNGIQRVIWQSPKGNLILNYYDSLVCWRAEILDDKIYDVKLKDNPIIIDIGSNLGFSILWFKYNYPNAHIYAFEPFKRSFELLQKNVKENNLSNVICNNVGILDKDCEIPFYHVRGGAGLGDSIVSNKDMEKETCKFENIDRYNFGRIDLCKIDAEGSEYPILKNCNFWKAADQLIIEFHDGFKEPLGYKDIDFIKLVEKAGFILTRKTNTSGVYICYFQKTLV